MSRTTSLHAADRLLNAIDRCRAPVCVGLDPVFDRLPESLRREAEVRGDDPLTCLARFTHQVLIAVAPHIPCVKFQSACFERYRRAGAGAACLDLLIGEARRLDLEVILDAKRGDIGISADHYAAAAFDSDAESEGGAADWITINSYLGEDGMRPFLRPGKGAFALVRTSNPGGDALQSLALSDGRTVAEAVADTVARIGRDALGERGYSSLGAVVGATKSDDAARLRERMSEQIFLVPGYGAQGGGAQDVLPCFKPDGTGAIVTASRSVIYAFKNDSEHWNDAVGAAAEQFADEIGRAVGMR